MSSQSWWSYSSASTCHVLTSITLLSSACLVFKPLHSAGVVFVCEATCLQKCGSTFSSWSPCRCSRWSRRPGSRWAPARRGWRRRGRRPRSCSPEDIDRNPYATTGGVSSRYACLKVALSVKLQLQLKTLFYVLHKYTCFYIWYVSR